MGRVPKFYGLNFRTRPSPLPPSRILWELVRSGAAGGKDKVDTFALLRFRQIEVTGKTFICSADFNAETNNRQVFGITTGEQTINVRFLFEPKLLVCRIERQWHPTKNFRTKQIGRVEMRLETTGRKELARWILSWMPEVKVLRPKSLQDQIAEKPRDGLRAQQ